MRTRSRISPGEAAKLSSAMEAFGTVELEIGAGKGRFLIGMAMDHPRTLFVGVEIRTAFAALMAARARKRSLENLIVLNDDIRSVFENVLEREALIDRIFMSFPDPWWKRRHADRYLGREDVLAGAVRALRNGGDLFIQSDVFSRAGEMLRLLTEHPGLENLAPDGGFLEAGPFPHKTARELACETLGLPVFRLLFRKIDILTG